MINHLRTALLATILICNSAHADLTVSIGNSNSSNRTSPVSVEAGSIVNLGLYLHNNRTDSTLVFNPQTFGLAFDVSLPGSVNFYDGHNSTQLSALSNFSITPVIAGNAAITSPNDVASSPIREFGYDVFVDFTASAPVPISVVANGSQANSIHLANISFRTAANLPIGTYGFKFNPVAQFPDNSPANAITSNLSLAVGQDGSSFNRFTVTAVPEPGSLLLGFSAIILCGSIARRQRRESPTK